MTQTRTKRSTLNAKRYALANDLLFEIGTEELPAAYIPALIDQLRTEAEALFKTEHLSSGAVAVYATPRRLVLFVKALNAIQQKPGEEVRGPSKQAAFDASGKPAPALQGFLRSQGGSLAQTKVVSTPKGDYVYLLKPPTTTPTAKLLPNLLAQLIGKLRSPKTMRWDGTGSRFARPIRWILAYYGSTPLKGVYGALTSQPKTRFGRPQTLRWVAVSSVSGYFSMLKRAGVILDHKQRQVAIECLVAKAAKAFHGTIAPEMIQYGLLEEVAFLTENPQALIGTFDKKYLGLPRDVLLASMAKHQRVFAIESSGKLLPRCIAILEGKAGKLSEVRKVVERILNARLADSLLFWNNDRKRNLENMGLALDGVTFHERFGSMHQKTLRLIGLSHTLGELWKLSSNELANLTRACQLCKADLVSTMVKEFPTLQGVMGKHYAKQSGESEEVAQAIEEHYLPLAGKLPRSLIGSAVGILDKYDTLISYFSIGITPTGDQDPFGLRRAAQGVVEIAWLMKRPVILDRLFEQWKLDALSQGCNKIDRQKLLNLSEQTFNEKKRVTHNYIFERLYTFDWAAPTPSQDCTQAVLATNREDLVDVMQRIQILHALRDNTSFLKAAKVMERTGNILKGVKLVEGQVEPTLLREEPEQALWQAYTANKDRVDNFIKSRSYEKATVAFGEAFYEPLHLFFDKVMVNAKDEALKRNRLALMRTIQTLYTDRIADLSKLTVLQQHKELP